MFFPYSVYKRKKKALDVFREKDNVKCEMAGLHCSMSQVTNEQSVLDNELVNYVSSECGDL